MKKGLLHHIELYVSNLNKTTEFWGWLLEELGYTMFQEWESGRSWRLGDTYIVFVQAEDRFLDVPFHRCRVGLNHLAFYASSRDHVDEITRKLKIKDVNILYLDRHPYAGGANHYAVRSEEHTSELQSRGHLVCRLLLE